jgi:hypothetical protein
MRAETWSNWRDENLLAVSHQFDTLNRRFSGATIKGFELRKPFAEAVTGLGKSDRVLVGFRSFVRFRVSPRMSFCQENK